MSVSITTLLLAGQHSFIMAIALPAVFCGTLGLGAAANKYSRLLGSKALIQSTSLLLNSFATYMRLLFSERTIPLDLRTDGINSDLVITRPSGLYLIINPGNVTGVFPSSHPDI